MKFDINAILKIDLYLFEIILQETSCLLYAHLFVSLQSKTIEILQYPYFLDEKLIILLQRYKNNY